MTALWPLYAVAISAALAAAAWGAERACLLYRRPARWAWTAALLASVLVPAAALVWPGAPDRTVPAHGIAPEKPAGTLLPWVRNETERPRASTIPPVPAALLWSWGALSLGTLAAFALGQAHIRRHRRRWPILWVAGTRVRISESFGPALVGVVRPEVILPRWVLALDDEALSLVLRHEREHLVRHDTLLLSAAFLVVAAAPWNPILWWQLARLRMAVELDCDLRVLRAGAHPLRYGSLLLQVGERSMRPRLAAAALSEPTSLLERRMDMITRTTTRGRIWQSTGALALTLVMVALACDMPAPTSLNAPPPAAAALESVQQRLEEGGLVRLRSAGDISSNRSPIIFIDGVRAATDPSSTQSPLANLDPSDIVRIEVVKGAAAVEIWGEEASGGAIHVFTKSGRSDAASGG